MAKKPIKKTTSSGVSARHPDYDKHAKKWKRARDVLAGQDDIHDGKEAYLPKLLNEEPSEFNARIERTPFFNASWRTVAGFVGMLYGKPATLECDDGLKEFLKDVTMTGRSFEDFSRGVAYEDFTTSRVGVFVDHPEAGTKPDGTALTVAEVAALNIRPSMTMFVAEDIIDHKKGNVNGKVQVTQVRILEQKDEQVSEFETVSKSVVRVLDFNAAGQYRQRWFDEETEIQIGGEVIAYMNGKPLDYIPFYFIGPDGTDADFEAPVLDDLFTHNVKHYQAYADYVHACHMTALPTPWITGYAADAGFVDPDALTPRAKPQSFNIGSTTAWVFPDHQTKVGFLEFNGGGISALKDLVAGYAEEMAAIGARMLAPEKSGVEAADTLAIRNNGENSIVGAVGIAVSGGLTQALNTFSQWAGFGKECKYELNREFMPFVIQAPMLTAWLSLVQAGRMSAQTLYWLLQRGDLARPDVDFEGEQTAIDADPVPRPVPVGNPALGVDGKPVDPVAAAKAALEEKDKKAA